MIETEELAPVVLLSIKKVELTAFQLTAGAVANAAAMIDAASLKLVAAERSMELEVSGVPSREIVSVPGVMALSWVRVIAARDPL